MPFYKRQGNTLHQAINTIRGPGYELNAADHATYSYPVSGWWWFDSPEEAHAALSIPVESGPITVSDWVGTVNEYRFDESLKQIAPPEEDARPAVEILAADAIAAQVVAEEIDGDDIEAVIALDLFPYWSPGVAYAAGAVLVHNGELIEVIQSHNSQTDWRPENVPALYKIHRAAGSVAPWVQPTGAHDAYQIGERVTHDRPQMSGAIWIFESKINANATEPGRDGTFDRWWLPVEPA
jgi:hypothetical protein